MQVCRIAVVEPDAGRTNHILLTLTLGGDETLYSMPVPGRILIERVEGNALWTIRGTYFSKALYETCMAVPGMHFDGPTRRWRGYADAIAAVAARLRLRKVGFEGEDLGRVEDPESWRSSRLGYLFATQGMPGYVLRPYQVEGVRFLIARSREGALLADSMRLGKSGVATVAARAFKDKTLVVCPSLALGVWGRHPKSLEGPGEIAKWWPDAWKANDGKGVVTLKTVKPFAAAKVIEQLGGRSNLTDAESAELAAAEAETTAAVEELKDVQVIICHYEIVYAWAEVLLRLGVRTLICDEVHLLSGYMSKRVEALKRIRAAVTHCIGLTGTPVTNNMKSMHNVIDILSPGRFGFFFLPPRLDGSGVIVERASYARLFCDSKQKEIGGNEDKKLVWDHSGQSNIVAPDGKWCLTEEETIHQRMKHFHLRRLKKDVDPQLPPKVRQVIDVEIPAKKAIAVSGKMIGPGGAELRRCLDLAADGKLPHAVALAVNHLAEGETTLVFCFRRMFVERAAADILKKAKGKQVEWVHGGLTQKERDKRIHRLRVAAAGGQVGALVCSIDTTSTAIDLSFASVAIVAELTWNAWELAQLEERLYKFGSGQKSLVEYLIARGTGDELVLEGVVKKLDLADKAIGETGDGMKEALDRREEDPMKALFDALVTMQKSGAVPGGDVPPEGAKVRKKKAKPVKAQGELC